MESTPKAVARLRLVALAVCAGALVWHALQYNFITDDAYISFVYARNFGQHGKLVFSLGHPPVEGYTNFLWTFLLGGLDALGIAPDVSAIPLGIAFGIATLAVALALSGYLWRKNSLWDAAAPALLALSSGYAAWSSGGLETQMFTFWVALSLYAYVRADAEPRWHSRLGLFLALAAMTRPEGLLVAGILGLHRLALNLIRDRRLRPLAGELHCVLAFLIVWAPWFAWRWHYYGYIFPNTYYVKAVGKASARYHHLLLENGLYYVWQWARQTKLLYAAPVAIAGLAVARPRTPRFVFGTAALALALAYLVYTVKVGGDFIGLDRFVMPLFFIGAVAVVLGLRLLLSLIRAAPARRIAAVAVPMAVIAAFGIDQARLTAHSMKWGNWRSDHGIDTPAFLYVYTHDRAAIGRQMRDCFKPNDFSIVGGAGAQPYYGHMKAIDVFGLLSARIAHEVPPTRPRAGHNKWGPNSLLLSYHPEFVFSCYSIHRAPDRPRFNCNPGFWLRNGYREVTLFVPKMIQRGKYYTFFVRNDRLADFQCKGRVR